MTINDGRPLTVVIAGGGTGGHLYPGIAVAREIVRRVPAARVSFAGTARGIEARVVPREGFELDVIRSAGLKGKSLAKRLSGAALLPASAIDARRLLARRRPHVVVGVGGYSSGPVVLLAAWAGIPTMVLEQNVVPGLTNRMLARWVRAAAVTFDATLDSFRGRGFVSGNPVRAEFFRSSNVALRHAQGVPSPSGDDVRASNLRRIVIIGGSQGAHAINVAMVAAAAGLAARHPGLEIVHQTGPADVGSVREGYARIGVAARAESFLDGMAGEMTAADLVVCRAGMTTLAELAALGRAAILVPLPGATDDHQRKNALALARLGAADVIEQGALTPDRLAGAVDRLLSDDSARGRMAAAMHTVAKPDAARVIVDRVLALSGLGGER